MNGCICGCGIVIPDGAVLIPDEFHLMKIADKLDESKLIISNGIARIE